MPENAFITFIPFTLPEGVCFASEQERYNKFVELLSGYLPGNFSTFNTGSSEPTVENRSLPWYKTFADGTPDGIYTYQNGNWIRPYPIPANSPMLMLWTGTVAALETYDGGNAGVVSASTGPFWVQETAFTDKIPVGAGTNAAVNVNAAQLASGASTSDEIRGVIFARRSARQFYVA